MAIIQGPFEDCDCPSHHEHGPGGPEKCDHCRVAALREALQELLDWSHLREWDHEKIKAIKRAKEVLG